ncbi:MAG TPA: glycosyltransferase family 4 protein [Telmatospirillum sp.]|nr:glycosyltransferase family 4 protein [Telmatospirillum sp.]
MTLLATSFFLPLIAVLVGTRWVLTWLLRKQILDHPNERSSHSRPTPRGGGLAVTPAILLAWIGLSCLAARAGGLGQAWTPVTGALILLILSWMDDESGLSARLRLGVHAFVVAVGLAAWPADQLLCQNLLPFWADRLIAFGAWLWFVNLFNFMDGIDGISGVETTTVGIGLTGVSLLSGDIGNAALAIVLVGAALGFLMWNWHPAKIFLGDSGSVPIGYLLGWLLLSAAGHGHWAAALILPAYYLTDATLTLTRRALRGERIWEAHRQHFYQKAIQGGASHACVASIILLANAILIILAWLSETHLLLALAGAAVDVTLLLMLLNGLGRRAPNYPPSAKPRN